MADTLLVDNDSETKCAWVKKMTHSSQSRGSFLQGNTKTMYLGCQKDNLRGR